jgi:hypothetical protein
VLHTANRRRAMGVFSQRATFERRLLVDWILVFG